MSEATTPISPMISQNKQLTTPRDKQKLPKNYFTLNRAPYGIYQIRPGVLIANRFKLTQKVGQGSFGQVYAAQDSQTDSYCVVKFEKRDNKPGNISLLLREIKVLQDLKGISGFPELMFYGRDNLHNYFMSSFLGLNLEQLFKKCGYIFSIPTVLQIAIQLIDRIEVFHSKNLINRDIKPENFVIGREDISLVYMIDFGLSKYFRNSDGKHIEYIFNKGMIGTARYSSINALEGKEQSRRDDLESIGYMLIYFAKGDLPWTNIQSVSKTDRVAKILRAKINISLNSLCKGLPKCFLQFFQHIKGLLFTEQPNYTMLRDLFRSALNQIEEQNLEKKNPTKLQDQILNTTILDWEMLPEFQILPEEPIQQFQNKQTSPKKTDTKQNLQHSQKKQVPQKQIKIQPNLLDTVSPDVKSKMISVNNSKYNNYESQLAEEDKKNVQLHRTNSDKMIVIVQNTQDVPQVKRKDSKSATHIAKPLPSHSKYKTKKILDDEFEMIAEDDQPSIQMSNYTSCNLKMLRQNSGSHSRKSLK